MSLRKHYERGFALITVLLMLVVVMSLMGAYLVTSNIELAQTKYSKDSLSGFYTAEAGLNIRAEEIRQIFVGYNRPSGVSPSSTDPCEASNQGTLDFRCKTYNFEPNRDVTYMNEDPSNPIMTTIPPGERFQNLNAQEYRYTVDSTAYNTQDRPSALLELRFKSRLVPLFQFQAFYNKDLEILPGPSMTLNGPIHTNGDLYLNTDNSSPGMLITGQITTAGDLYRGRKNLNVCNSNPVNIMDPTTARTLVPSCATRVKVAPTSLAPWNNMIQVDVQPLTVPPPEALDPLPANVYFNKADLRLALKLNSSDARDTSHSSTGVEVRTVNNTLDAAATNLLHTCTCSTCISNTHPAALKNIPVGSDWNSNLSKWTYYSQRELKVIRMLEVDMKELLKCLAANPSIMGGKQLNDTTEGGLVFHFTVDGPNSYTTPNSYGVRIRNADELKSAAAGAPTVKGMSVISDQAVYVKGHYNSVNKKPAAIMCDAVNILSNNWNFTLETGAANNPNWANRNATATTVNAAFLAGTDSTGGVEGAAGQGGAYNGGLENYPRFQENWGGITFTYRGSFVSLNTPRHSTGVWVNPGSSCNATTGCYYAAPTRAWAYDTAFNDAANLPPLTPRFVYLRQELFVRDYEQDSL